MSRLLVPEEQAPGFDEVDAPEPHGDSASEPDPEEEEANEEEEAEQVTEENGYYGEGEVLSDALASSALSQDDPLRMRLTEEEADWAWELKKVIENSKEINNLIDFKYAAMAIVNRGDIQASLKQAANHQSYLEDHGLQDTLQEQIQVLRFLATTFPRLFLGLLFFEKDGRYVFIYSWKGIDLTEFNTPEKSRFWAAALLYPLYLINPDLHAVRRGFIFIADCKDFDWKRNMDLKTVKMFWRDCSTSLPLRPHKLKYFNTGVFFNTIFSMCRKLIASEVLKIIEVGCSCEGIALADHYLVPDVETANARILGQLEAAAERRHQNEQSFRLPRRKQRISCDS